MDLPIGLIGEVSRITPINVHHIDIPVSPIPQGSKSNALTVRRPYGILVTAVTIGEVSPIATIGVHNENVKVAIPNGNKDNAFAVRRP